MLNFRLLVAGIALTVMSGYVFVNMDTEAEACCYYMSIDAPDDNTVFFEGDQISVFVNWHLPGDEFDPVVITAELQCTMTSRLEDSDPYEAFVSEATSFHVLVGPNDCDCDVADDFCIFVSGGGESDRIGATFIPFCICCP